MHFDDGNSVTMSHTGAEPLGFDDLLALTAGERANVKVTLYGDRALINGEMKEGRVRAVATMNFDKRTTVYALVQGGWLPPPFVLPPNFLVDRNVVSVLRSIRLGASRGDLAATKWWLQFFNDPRVLFNPVLCALEGATRSVPRFSDFRIEFDKGRAELCQALPGVSVVSLNDEALAAAYQIILDLQERAEREISFLRAVAPSLTSRVSDREFGSALERLFGEAHAHRVARDSLVFLAALSCLAEDKHGSGVAVGRKLLKPSASYTVADAYNALADMRHLEMLIQSHLLPGRESFALCTADQALALFWAGIAPREIAAGDGAASFTVTLEPGLFPRLGPPDLERVREGLS